MRSVIGATLSWIGTPDRAPRVIAGVVLVLFLAQVLSVAVLEGVAGLLAFDVLPGVVMHAIFALAIVGGAVRTSRGPLAADRYPRLIGWYVGGLLAFAAVNALLIAFFPADGTVENLGWFLFAGSMGAGAGFVVGLVEARAIDRAVTAERAAAETEWLSTQRDRFEYMNALLRHEVLNNAQVVHGNAEFLLDEVDDPALARRLEVVRRQCEDMAEVVEDVRLVSEGLENTDLVPMDLAAILRSELADLEDAHDPIEMDLDLPEGIYVCGDGLLARVFSNLLTNAVEHNDAAVPRVEVTAQADSDVVTVHVADNGPGIAEGVRESLFDRTTGPHGIGLYLVDTLVTHYGGSVEIAETGPDGTVFTVELERVEAPAETATGGAESEIDTGSGDDASDYGAFDSSRSVVSDDED